MKTEFGFMTLQNDATCQPRIQPSCVTHKWGESFRQKTHNSKIWHGPADFRAHLGHVRRGTLAAKNRIHGALNNDRIKILIWNVERCCIHLFPCAERRRVWGFTKTRNRETKWRNKKKEHRLCRAEHSPRAQTTYMSVRLCRQVWRSSGQ